MNFIGIDLAWKVKPTSAGTGIVVIDENARVVNTLHARSDEEILDFVKEHAGRGCVVGIDAPLVVKNLRGQRTCERSLHKRGIRAYPANREWLTNAFGGVRGEILVEKLRSIGIELKDKIGPREFTRAAMEVYPHASWKILFNMRSKGIQELSDRLDSVITGFGKYFDSANLKKSADLLDAAMAAYTTLIYWMHGDAKCLVLGSKEEGFILIPAPCFPLSR